MRRSVVPLEASSRRSRRTAPPRDASGRRSGRPIRFAGALVVAAAAALLVPGAANAASVADQWTGTYGDSGNASTNAGEQDITASTASKVTTAWTAVDGAVGPYAPTVLGGVTYSLGSGTAPTLIASAPRTGARLWTLPLPGGTSQYGYGVSGTGSTVLIAFRGDPGGVLAVDTTKRAIVWRATLPAATIAGDDNDYPGQPSTDGTHVYVTGASNAVNAYSLTTGALLWTIPFTFTTNGTLNGVDGVAAGDGYVYTSGSPTGGRGLVAYSAATGKQVWQSSTAAAWGKPVLAGGRVFAATSSGVEAFSASGCGKATCSPAWTAAVGSYYPTGPTVAAADATSVYVTSTTLRSGAAPACGSAFVGTVTRLSAPSGQTQWHVAVGDAAQGLVHGGSTVWLINDYWSSSAAGGCAEGFRILSYSASATGSAPLRSIALPSTYSGFPQTLAVASGTLFETVQSTLIGYRVPKA